MYEGGMRVISLVRAPQLGLTPNTVNYFNCTNLNSLFCFFSFTFQLFHEKEFTFYCKSVHFIVHTYKICSYNVLKFGIIENAKDDFAKSKFKFPEWGVGSWLSP